MSIKKSQAILKRFIDLKFIVWFTLVSENETTLLTLFSGRLPVKTLNDRQSGIFNKFDLPKNPRQSKLHMEIEKSREILKCFIDLKCSVWFTLGSENE